MIGGGGRRIASLVCSTEESRQERKVKGMINSKRRATRGEGLLQGEDFIE